MLEAYRWLPLVLLLTLAGCGGDENGPDATSEDGPTTVYTTFYPTTYFAERLAGDAAEVVCPIPEDEDPIFYRPPASMILEYQAADLVIVNGAEFEKWVLTTSLSDEKRVDTARAFQGDWLTFEEATEHSHGPSGAHAHEGVDGHTWLDPVLAKQQAAAIAKALQRLLPAEAEAIGGRLEALHADLDALDAELKRLGADYDGEALYASHPAYNYLAKRYGWKVVNLDLDPESMPGDDVFAEVRAKLADHPGRYLLWESEPLPEIAQRFEDELGLASVLFSPVEMLGAEERAAGEDYLTVMRANLERIAPALRPAP